MLETFVKPTRGPRRLTCLDLPRDLVLGRLSCLNLIGDTPVQRSKEVYMPQPAQGPNSPEANCLDLPSDSVSRRLSCKPVMPQPTWGSAP